MDKKIVAKIGDSDTRTWVHKFQTRAMAREFAKKNDAKVEECPMTGSNKFGYYKYQVVTVGRGTH